MNVDAVLVSVSMGLIPFLSDLTDSEELKKSMLSTWFLSGFNISISRDVLLSFTIFAVLSSFPTVAYR